MFGSFFGKTFVVAGVIDRVGTSHSTVNVDYFVNILLVGSKDIYTLDAHKTNETKPKISFLQAGDEVAFECSEEFKINPKTFVNKTLDSRLS